MRELNEDRGAAGIYPLPYGEGKLAALRTWMDRMQIYANLMILALLGVALSAYLSFQEVGRHISFISIVLSYVVFLLVTHLLTKRELEARFGELLARVRKKYQIKIVKLKQEHDTSTLERTIRDGTRTLIKNAVDYFKIDNIKNEMGASAAIQNLQLDKYGQIIELLADFSLILPDYEENQQIVQQEIYHQIDIYEIDERSFAEFLKRILEKYRVAYQKKLREKETFESRRESRVCPQCAEKVTGNPEVCIHCGHAFSTRTPARAADESPEDIHYIREGIAYYRQRNLNDALRSFTRAIDLNPAADQAFYNRGIIYMKKDDQIPAIDDLKTAARLGHPRARRVLKVLKMMRTQNGNWTP